MKLFKYIKKSFDFKGRNSTKEYWLGVLHSLLFSIAFILLVISPIYILAHFLISFTQGLTGGSDVTVAKNVVNIISFLLIQASILFPIIIFHLGIIPRLHDQGKTGWLALLGLIPVVGTIIIIVFTFMPSDPNTNKWG